MADINKSVSGKLVRGVGINDVPHIFSKYNTDINIKRAYKIWYGILRNTEIEGNLLDESWVYLSNFIKDMPEIEGYDIWLKDADTDLCGNKYELTKKNAKKPYTYSKDTVMFKKLEEAIRYKTDKYPFESRFKNNPAARVRNEGINDVYGVGADSADELLHRKYVLWKSMVTGTEVYANVRICERWKVLSQFLEDVENLDGYQFWAEHPEANQILSFKRDITDFEYNIDTVTFIEKNKAILYRFEKFDKIHPIKVTDTNTGEVWNFKSKNDALVFLRTSNKSLNICLNSGELIDQFKIEEGSLDEPYSDPNISVVKERRHKTMPVKLIFPDNTYKIYDSIRIASKESGIPLYSLNDMLRGKGSSYTNKGYKIERMEEKIFHRSFKRK